jgi:hypothetical protein
MHGRKGGHSNGISLCISNIWPTNFLSLTYSHNLQRHLESFVGGVLIDVSG